MKLRYIDVYVNVVDRKNFCFRVNSCDVLEVMRNEIILNEKLEGVTFIGDYCTECRATIFHQDQIYKLHYLDREKDNSVYMDFTDNNGYKIHIIQSSKYYTKTIITVDNPTERKTPSIMCINGRLKTYKRI